MLLLATILVAGCSSGGRNVRVRVIPSRSLADEPVHVRVAGLEPDQRVVVRLSARDARGRLWRSRASFRADAGGEIDLDRTPPVSGSYRGAWGGGLLASLARPAPPTGDFYRWSASGPQAFRVDVLVGGERLGGVKFYRRLPRVRQRLLTTVGAGFYGRYFAPPRGHPLRRPVLVFGGSEGGLSFRRILPALLAWRGHPTLSLAYFRAPGLPPQLKRIPLEYFARALRWLRARPGAGRRRAAVVGVSRGSEAAQLLGVHYPGLVGAVVGAVPSNSAICGLPDCSGPAWTFGGRAVPYTRELDFTQPTDDPRAVISVERIHGPLLLVCGGRDAVWRSCAYARAIEARRRRSGRASGDVVYRYPRAGHFVGALRPYAIPAPRWLYFKPADERAREDLWPHVLSFLARG